MRPHQLRMKAANCAEHHQNQTTGVRGIAWCNDRCQGFEDTLEGLEILAVCLGEDVLASSQSAVVRDVGLQSH